MPDVPTIAETIPGFDNSSWFGLMGPAGTPKPIVAKVNTALNNIFGSADIAQQLMAVGVEAATTTPEGFEDMIRSEHTRWQRIVQKAGVKLTEER